MHINELKELSYKQLKDSYKNWLQNKGYSKNTIDTFCSDAFFLYRHASDKCFWEIVTSDDFEIKAKKHLTDIFENRMAKDKTSEISQYITKLRSFRKFLADDDIQINILKDGSSKRITKNNKAKKDERPTKKQIIINKMYGGRYLLENENIGHEIINLYKADDGNNYIYLNAPGNIDKQYAKDDLTVLLVRRSGKKYKILAKAVGITVIESAYSSKSQQQRYKEQVELNLSYGGVKLDDLFSQNTFGGSLQAAKNVYATFQTNKIIKPVNELFITDVKSLTDDKTFYVRTPKGFGTRSLRLYFDEVDKKDSYDDLESVINNESLWESEDTTAMIPKTNIMKKDENFNFLNVIKQEYNELVYSNLLAYFFSSNREVFVKFSKDVLGVSIKPNFSIEREKHHIDMLICDDRNVIVIENKIKSSISGSDERHNIYSDLVQSQLSKYYKYVTTNKEYKDKESSCFIFSPDYNYIDLKGYESGEQYKVINYSEIYDFFKDNEVLFKDVPYFKDFIKALYRHTKPYDNDLEEEMQRRFILAIQKYRTIEKYNKSMND